jgi:capsular exopolysaccharide synthesis family protein
VKLADVLRILRTQWITVAACFILATGASAVAALLTPPTYAASTTLVVTIPMGDGRGVIDAYEAGLFSHQRVASYMELLTSEKVARRTIKALNLNMTPEELAGELTASTKPDTVLIFLGVKDRSASQAAQIANEVSNQFVQVIAELEKPLFPQQPVARVVVEQSAEVPENRLAPHRKTYVELGMLIGALLGFGLAALRDYLDRTVKTLSQVEELTGATVLGLIPDVGKRSGDRALLPNADAITLEAYRTLRTNVRFLDGEGSPRSFVMTSPGSHEGTTSVAVNMAYVLAKDDKTVALLEGNFRSPSLSEYLRLDSALGHSKKREHVGLSDILARRNELEESVQQSHLHGMAVITAGTPPAHPSELLGSVDAQVVLSQLQARFDYVIIDAPPVLPFTDATLLAKEANGAILVVRAGKTKCHEVAAAAAKLTAVNARLLGVVVITSDYRKLSTTGFGNTHSNNNGEQRHVNAVAGYVAGQGISKGRHSLLRPGHPRLTTDDYPL